MTDAEKVSAIKFCVERFDCSPCSSVEIGLIKRKEDCQECAETFLSVVRDILDGKGLPIAPWSNETKENDDG